MKKPIEYRVRAVTRFIVTEHDPAAKTTTQIAEVDGGGTANLIAEAFALQAKANAPERDAIAVPVTEPLPGKVMRCKVKMWNRQQQWAMNVDERGNPVGRTIEVPAADGYSAHTRADPTDPANVKPDGELITFGAVCKGFDKDGVSEIEENRIFGYWSPSFNISGHVRNQAVLDNLEVGAEYYVDFTPAPNS